MSGDQAFYSFCNYMKTQLTGSGLNVYVEESGAKTAPFINFQMLAEDTEDVWVSNQLCQAWLVVEKIPTEPVMVTFSRYKKLVQDATRDVGHLEKYDYTQTPKVLTGSFLIKNMGTSPNLSSDPLRPKRVITWELISNAVT